MTLRLIDEGAYEGPLGRARVYWCSQWRQYIVKHWMGSGDKFPSDYYTDDEQDARNTAQVMVREPRHAET